MKKYLGILFMTLVVMIMVPIIASGLLVALMVMLLGMLFKEKKVEQYGFKMLVSFDQTGNTILGGDEDETVSSRAGKRQHEQAWAKGLCNILDKVDPGHCDRYIEKDEGNNSILED